MQQHKAIIDASGNVILPGLQSETVPVADVQETSEQEYEFTLNDEVVDMIVEEEMEEVPVNEVAVDPFIQEWTIEESADLGTPERRRFTETAKQASSVWHEVRGDIRRVTGDAYKESAQQLLATLADGSHSGVDALRSTGGVLVRTWRFLKQPVWIPNRKKQPVQYSRGALFLIDTLRFGGTFATLFAVLFASLNYQSFLSIGSSYITPLAELTGIVQAKDASEMSNKLQDLSGAANDSTADLAGFLPPVGPPENRLVIPKLNLNVPIVIPPTDALIAEDWKKLEEDIQIGLQDGVVHYPGTARPGKPGNFFVTGHSSYYPWAPGEYKSVFARLHDLNVGDEYWIFYNGDRYRYIIDSKKEIKPSDVSVLDQPVDERMGTLMTCTPIGTTLRRLILSAQEVDPVSGKPLEVGEHIKEALPKTKMEMLPI